MARVKGKAPPPSKRKVPAPPPHPFGHHPKKGDVVVRQVGDYVYSFTPYHGDFVAKAKVIGAYWFPATKEWGVHKDQTGVLQALCNATFGRYEWRPEGWELREQQRMRDEQAKREEEEQRRREERQRQYKQKQQEHQRQRQEGEWVTMPISAGRVRRVDYDPEHPGLLYQFADTSVELNRECVQVLASVLGMESTLLMEEGEEVVDLGLPPKGEKDGVSGTLDARERALVRLLADLPGDRRLALMAAATAIAK